MFEIFEGVLNKYNGEDKIVVIPQEVNSIGEFAFYGCLEIEKVILHENVNSIGQFAFYGCEHLETIENLEHVSLIGSGAFSCCYALKEFKLSKKITILNKSTFYRCRSLQSITIPEFVSTIDRGAFGFCHLLSEVNFNNRLKTIGETAFEGCNSLTHVDLPDSVQKIGKKAFYNCVNLKELNLSINLKEVEMAAFETHSKIKIISKGSMILKPKMFDEHYMFDVVQKNAGNYQFENSYFPNVIFKEWKPVAKIMLLVNFLETYHMHQEKNSYQEKLEEYKDSVISLLIKEKRFIPLNIGIEEGIFNSNDLEPYFDMVTDREQKAKMMEYRNKEVQNNNSFASLDNLLDDLF